MKTLINILIIILIIISINSCNIRTEIKDEVNFYKSKLGDTIIIRKDTAIIIDYNTFMSTFTLSNGLVINKDFLINNK